MISESFDGDSSTLYISDKEWSSFYEDSLILTVLIGAFSYFSVFYFTIEALVLVTLFGLSNSFLLVAGPGLFAFDFTFFVGFFSST